MGERVLILFPDLSQNYARCADQPGTEPFFVPWANAQKNGSGPGLRTGSSALTREPGTGNWEPKKVSVPVFSSSTNFSAGLCPKIVSVPVF